MVRIAQLLAKIKALEELPIGNALYSSHQYKDDGLNSVSFSLLAEETTGCTKLSNLARVNLLC